MPSAPIKYFIPVLCRLQVRQSRAQVIQEPPPPYEGNEPYIFVCYAHEDAAVVYPELTWLDSEGFRYWYDEGITPGDNWPEALVCAIEGATVFLMFISPAAVDRQAILRHKQAFKSEFGSK